MTRANLLVDIRNAYHLRANGSLVKPCGFEKIQIMAQAIRDFWFLQNQPAFGSA